MDECSSGAADPGIGYILNAFIDAEKLGAPRHPHMSRYVDYLLGHFDQIFVSKTYKLHQTFYDGLGAETLIDYYELSRDARVPPAIQSMLDWVWENGWNHITHRLVYNPEPFGTRCSEGGQKYSSELVNLVSPAFAWYWRLTGDATYLERGDELFRHSLDMNIDYSGKIFSQNYKWSFDYVKWRTGTERTCKYSVSPESTSIGWQGGVSKLELASEPGCAWTVSGLPDWIAITSLPAGPNPGRIVMNVAPNASVDSRSATIGIAVIPVTIRQSAKTNLTSLVSNSVSVMGGGTAYVNAFFTSAAPATGAEVRFATSDPSIAAVTPAASAAPGSYGVNAAVVTKPTDRPTTVRVTATLGTSSQTVDIAVYPALIRALALPETATSGSNIRVYFYLAAPAPRVGTTISFTTSCGRSLRIPATVSLREGEIFAQSLQSVPTEMVRSTTACVVTAAGPHDQRVSNAMVLTAP